MLALLNEVLQAHGGIENWKKYDTITADMSITGSLWGRKGWPDAIKDVVVEAETKRMRSGYRRFVRPEWISTWEPDRVVVDHGHASAPSERDDPHASFEGHEATTPWDELHLAYFSGYAIWNYLNTPFVFTDPGFSIDEMDETTSEGERLRRLKVVYPDGFPTHSKEQVFYIGDDGLLRRLDYQANITGGQPCAHLLFDYKLFDGFAFPTKRRATPRDSEGRPVHDKLLVGLDTSHVRLS